MKQMQLQDQSPEGGLNPSVMNSRRVPLERKVILKFHHFGGFFVEYSANISMTGMFIRTESPKPAGSIFIFEIWLGDEYKLVHGVGEVVWVRQEGEGSSRPAGMGIRYLKIDDESRAVIERVIAEQVEKGGEVFDLANAGPSSQPAQAPTEDRRSELSLVDIGSQSLSRADLLVVDEDLLGFDSPPVQDPLIESTRDRTAQARSWRGLRVAVLLAFLAAAMGGAAYLFSADLLPF